MNESKKTVDFNGLKLFIGIDVHRRQWTVTIRLRDLALNTFSMNPSPKELYNHLKRVYPNAEYYSVYEAGFCGFWIHRQLCQLGIKNIVVNPADIPTTHKEKTQKRDKTDSRKLARQLAQGTSLKAIYIPTPEQESMRLLSRLLVQITKRTTQTKNRIKQFLHTQGIHLPQRSEISHWSRNFINWLNAIQFQYNYSKYYLDKLLRDLQKERTERLYLLRQIRKITKDNQTIRRLRSVPGVGPITAFTLYAEIMDINRFQNLDQLIAFIGIIPSVEATDEKEKILGLTNRYNKFLRNRIIEAAWVAVRTDPALTLAFNNLIKSRSKQKAIIRIAKKLVNRIRYVWKNQQQYVTAVVE
ncbi:MAG: IS110 family transposase [Candidatus Aminicenantia bacterium]